MATKRAKKPDDTPPIDKEAMIAETLAAVREALVRCAAVSENHLLLARDRLLTVARLDLETIAALDPDNADAHFAARVRSVRAGTCLGCEIAWEAGQQRRPRGTGCKRSPDRPHLFLIQGGKQRERQGNQEGGKR